MVLEAFNRMNIFPFSIMDLYSNRQQTRKLDDKVRLEFLNLNYVFNPQTRPSIRAVENRSSLNEYKISLNEKGTKYNYTYTKSDSKSLDVVLGVMTELIAFYDTFYPRSKSPTKPIDDKINLFLNKHAGVNYSEFIKNINFEDFNENDYGSLPNSGLKKKLFEYRAKLYLGALAVAEERGFDVKTVLAEISQSKICPIKKEINEPTFDYISELLVKR